MSTVHGYLSAKNEIVIHSGVCTESHGFTKKPGHQAVVITRARLGYLLICNATKLQLVRDRNETWDAIKKALVERRDWSLETPLQYSKVFRSELDISKALYDTAAPRIEERKVAAPKRDLLKKVYGKAIEEESIPPIFDKILLAASKIRGQEIAQNVDFGGGQERYVYPYLPSVDTKQSVMGQEKIVAYLILLLSFYLNTPGTEISFFLFIRLFSRIFWHYIT